MNNVHNWNRPVELDKLYQQFREQFSSDRLPSNLHKLQGTHYTFFPIEAVWSGLNVNFIRGALVHTKWRSLLRIAPGLPVPFICKLVQTYDIPHYYPELHALCWSISFKDDVTVEKIISYL